jgi:hypothetical protein
MRHVQGRATEALAMFTTRGLLGLATSAALLVGAAAGCDDGGQPYPDPNPAPPATSTAPVATQPAARLPGTEKPAPPQPVETFMSIAMADVPQPRMVAFPPAKLRLKKSADGMLAVLYTDDPPAAASKDYRGNSYLFEMELPNVTGGDALDRAQYRYHVEAGSAAADRAVETTNGVFLNGWDTHLQPADVVVVFEGRPPQLMVKVVGTFRVVTSDKEGPAKGAMVQAVLPAIVDSSSK